MDGNRGAYFTRGTTKNRYAGYSETGPDYVENVQRLLKKFATAAKLMPPAVIRQHEPRSRFGVIYFGSTSPAMQEADDILVARGAMVDLCRLRGFPFGAEVEAFVDAHEIVFVVEQNRDAQMRTLLVTELDVESAKMIPVLHYDGTPITARFIVDEIADRVLGSNVESIDRAKAA